MWRRAFVAGAGRLAAAGLGVTAGCNAPRGGETKTETAAPTPTPARARHITMRGITGAARINPVGLYVQPGEAVVFAVESGPHSSRAYHPDNGTERRIPEAADPWRSPALSADQSFTVTLGIPGTYDWYCATHRNHGRVGRIVVGEPGGPAEESPPPHGRLPDSERIVERGAVSHAELYGGG